MTRKRRTREHVIEDLSFNHVERFVLFCGWSVQRQDHDYGIDLTIHSYDKYGEIQNGYINVQLKATDHLISTSRGSEVAYSVKCSDLSYWLAEPYPVILIRYDAQQDQAYWLHVQEYVQSRDGFNVECSGQTVRVHIPSSQVVTQKAVLEFARRKESVLQEFWR